MLTMFNIVLLLLVFATSIVPFGGDTWVKGEGTIWRRILPRGWIAIALFVLTLSVGVAKELQSLREDRGEKAASKERLDAANARLDLANGRLDELKVILAPPDVRQPQVAPARSGHALDGLVVRQTVRRASADEANPHTITLEADLPTDYPDRAGILARMTKVVYYLDPRWYSRPIVEVSNPIGGFRYTFGAFGPTQVTARIYLEGPDEVVVRTGRISTTEPQTFSASSIGE
jgi:hypothetical protein